MSGMTGGDITTLTGNAGGLIPASGSGNFNIVGSGSIVVTGAPATHTLTISGGGVTGMTEHAMVVGNAAGGITSLAVATDGQLPIGSTGNNPVLATLTAGNNIGITNAAGSITIKVNGTTNHTVQVGNGTGDLTSLAVGATGVILQGVTASDPTWSTATYPSTVVKGDVLVASADNTIGVVNDVTNAGYVLTANVGAAPSFQAPPAGVTYASDAETIAGTVTNKAVAPSNLKAKLGTQTLHGLPIGASDSVAIAWTAEPTDGQILIGKTGNQPVLATISSGNNITATAGAGTISIAVTGTTQHAVQVGGAAGQLASLAVGTTGKYLRAVTTADPAWSTLTLPDTVTKGDVLVASADNVVSSVAGATTAGHVLMANGAGSAPTFQALPASGIATVTGTANQVTATTVGSDVTLSIPSTFIAPGTIAATTTVTAGTNLVSTAGNLELPQTTTTIGYVKMGGARYLHSSGYSNNIFLGYEAGSTSGGNGYNIGIGYQCMKNSTSSINQNVLIGSFSNLHSGSCNTMIGSGIPVYDGSYNVAIGTYIQATGKYSGGDIAASATSNIIIQNPGQSADTNTIRIGNAGSGNGQQNRLFIAGAYGVTPAGTLNVALVDSNGQFGSVASLGVAQGGTGAATLTDHGILLGSGTGAITPLGAATDGQLPIGSTGADPVLATITAGSGISVTNGAGSITIAATGGSGMSWSEITAATKTIVNNEAYVANYGTMLTFTLPATAALGTEFKIQGKGAGGWKIAQNAGQTIHVGSSASTTGAAGYIASTDTYDAITLVCITADTDWATEAVVGNITVA